MEELLLQRDEATRNRLRQAQDFLDPRMPLDLPAPPSPRSWWSHGMCGC